jgi:hypothetical protein
VSADTLAALVIFFLPKLVASATWTEEAPQGLSSHTFLGLKNAVARWISSLPSMSWSDSRPSKTDHAVAVESVVQVSFAEEEDEGSTIERSQQNMSAADNTTSGSSQGKERTLSAIEESDRSGETKQSTDPESGTSAEASESGLVSLLRKKLCEQEETIALLKDQMANMSKKDMLSSAGTVDEC